MMSSFALTSQQQYQRRLSQIQRDLDTLSATTARDVFTLLAEMRRTVVAALALVPVTDGTWPAYRGQALLSALDEVTRELNARLTPMLQQGVQQAWEMGAQAQFTALGFRSPAVTGIDLDTLLFAQQMQADLVRKVTLEFRQRAAREITMVTAGVRSPYEATQNVGELLRTQPKRNVPGMGLIAAQAERIVRTETMGVFNLADRARDDDVSERVPGLRKFWDAASDARTRPSHADADARYRPGGRTGPISLGADFMVGGERASGPHDPRLSAAERVNCFPGSVYVRPVGVIERIYRRWYEGEVVTIETAHGYVVSGTPNHPIATAKGWITLSALEYGMDVVCGPWSERVDRVAVHPDVDDCPVTFEEIYEALSVVGSRERHCGLVVDFHGDGRDGDVDVVSAGCHLRDRVMATSAQQRHQVGLESADVLAVRLVDDRATVQLIDCARLATNGIVGLRSEDRAFRGRQSGHAQAVGFGAASTLDAGTRETLVNDDALDAVGGSKRQDRLARLVTGDDLGVRQAVFGRLDRDASAFQEIADLARVAMVPLADGREAFATTVGCDKIIRIKRERFAGHVYNLQTSQGCYTANDILAHNCRCVRALWSPEWA